MNMRMPACLLPLTLVGLGAALSTGCLEDLPSPGSAVDGESRVQGYATSARYERLVFEVDFVEGMKPLPAAERGVVETTRTVVDKPGGVEVVYDGSIASRGADHAWTTPELQSLAGELDDLAVDEKTTKIHVMFVDGHSASDTENGRILGLAWGNRHIAIFKKTITEGCQGPLVGDRLCAFAERAIWTHEVGHVLGLVANGAPLVDESHHDEEHGAHCTNQDCVMYWAYESGDLLKVLRERLISGDDSALVFDADCRADLAAIGQ